MCCISKEKKTKTVETEIHVIKVLQKKSKGYRTPFTHQYIRKDIMSGEMPFVAVCDDSHLSGRLLDDKSFMNRMIYLLMGGCKELYAYDKNFIHTYPSDKIGDFTEEQLKELKNKGFEFFDCIIPVGAECIEGEVFTTFDGNKLFREKSYASSQIYIVGKHEFKSNEKFKTWIK